MLQAYAHMMRMMPIQLDLGQWRQSLIERFFSVPQQNYKNRREEKRERQRETEPERQRQTDRERQRYKETERHKKRGGKEETRMNNNNETNTLAPLWPYLWKDNTAKHHSH